MFSFFLTEEASQHTCAHVWEASPEREIVTARPPGGRAGEGDGEVAELGPGTFYTIKMLSHRHRTFTEN